MMHSQPTSKFDKAAKGLGRRLNCFSIGVTNGTDDEMSLYVFYYRRIFAECLWFRYTPESRVFCLRTGPGYGFDNCVGMGAPDDGYRFVSLRGRSRRGSYVASSLAECRRRRIGKC